MKLEGRKDIWGAPIWEQGESCSDLILVSRLERLVNQSTSLLPVSVFPPKSRCHVAVLRGVLLRPQEGGCQMPMIKRIEDSGVPKHAV
jgi:hypothetical protein